MDQITLQTIAKSIASVRQTISDLERLVALQMTHVQVPQQLGNQQLPQQPGNAHPYPQPYPQQQQYPGVQQNPNIQYAQPQQQYTQQQPDPRAAQYEVARSPVQHHPQDTGYLNEDEERRLGMAMGFEAHAGEYIPDQHDARADALRMQFGQHAQGGAPHQGGVASYLRSGGAFGQ